MEKRSDNNVDDVNGTDNGDDQHVPGTSGTDAEHGDGASGSVGSDNRSASSGSYEDPIDLTGQSDGTDGTGSGAGSGTGTRKRRNGSSETSTTGKAKISTSRSKNVPLTAGGERTLAKQVVGLHKLFGIVVGLPEVWSITEDQAEEVTKSVLDVMALYKIKPNAKIVAWSNLAAVAAAVYAPKVIVTVAAVNAKKKARPVQVQKPDANPRPIKTDMNGNPMPDSVQFG